nr:MAG TPA: hypothetical protein [Caudoviricetes sp.]
MGIHIKGASTFYRCTLKNKEETYQATGISPE